MKTPLKPVRALCGALMVVSVGVVAAPGLAHAEGTDIPARYEMACRRIPVAQERVDSLIARIRGDAATLGSLAWLNARIAEAEAAGRTQLVTVLENRLTARTRALEALTQRQTRLGELRARCAEHGVTL